MRERRRLIAASAVRWLREAALGAVRTGRRAVSGFLDDGSPQSAAAISYYGLFSLFPLAILAVAAFSLVADDSAARSRIIDLVLDNVPLREDRGRKDLEQLLVSVTDQARGFGITGLLGLVFAASGVMGAIRNALNRAWDVTDPRPIVQAKAIDFLLVLGLGVIIAASFAITLAARLTASLGDDLDELLGPAGATVPRLLLELGPVVPVLVAFGAFALLFSVVPACDTRLKDTWRGAAVAAVGFEAAKTGFAFYLANFANYGAIYASLAAIVAFLVFLFVTANVALLGAQVAVAWPAVRDGEPEDEQDEPLKQRAAGAVKRLVVREHTDASER